MPSYKLIYFDGRGRAEVSRLLFAYSRTKYEDARLNQGEWQELKQKTPFGQLPVLDVDGQMIGQSVAIANFLAREFGLNGKTSMETCQIDQIICTIQDFWSSLIKAVFEKDEAKKVELMKVHNEETIPKFLAIFEKLLGQSGTSYFVGSSVTLADLAVYDFTWNILNKAPTALDNFPRVKANHDVVGAVPQIKSYVDARKPTEM